MAIRRQPRREHRVCFFCKEELSPAFNDISVMERFLTDRGKIVGSTRSGVCAKHQRLLTREVKRARFLALLPFVQKS
ncbi:30S ribosomal protein S18 [Candidatus Microgenomates bacterium]|nr:30S ribosomal protein S18 [Candidatus Microgenomates bacterium]